MAVGEDQAKEQVHTYRGRIVDPEPEYEDRLSPEDRDVLIEFDERLTKQRKRNNRCGWYHHSNVLTELYVFAAEIGGLAESLQEDEAGDEALSDITDWIFEQDFSGYSIQGYLSSLRVFASTICGGEDEMPDHYQEIEPGSHVENDPAPLPSNVVEYAEVIDMIEAIQNPRIRARDRALLLTQWDAGLRPMKELYPLQYKHVEIEDDHIYITVPKRDKSEDKPVLVTTAAPALRFWIEEAHPVHDDPEASLGPETYIWTKTNENTHLSYGGMTARFEKAGERIGFEKDHSCQHFRRSSASIMAGKPQIGERELRARYNWSPGSFAPEHYIQVHSRDVNHNVAEARGHDVESMREIADTAPIICEHCGSWTCQGLEQCINCDTNLDPEQETISTTVTPTQSDTIEAKILNGDLPPWKLRAVQELEPHILNDPTLFDRLPDLITQSEALPKYDDEDTPYSSVFGIGGAIAWGSAKASQAANHWARAKHAAMAIHPEFEEYPPNTKQMLGILGGWSLILGITVPVLLFNGLLGRIVSGDPTAVISLVISLVIGSMIVGHDIPSIEEAIEAANG